MSQQQERARLFRALHAHPPLVLPNAWDALSARAMERAGAPAIATTSGGMAWSHGKPDGQALSREDTARAVGRIASAVSVPVSADIESGYGSGAPDDVAATVEAVLAAGAVGINLEDGPGRDGAPLLTASDQVARIAAARRAAEAARVEVFINARTDVFLRAVGDPGGRVAAAAGRANACLDAGADCAFVPGVADLATIARLVESIRGPVNVLAGPAGPSVPQLAGVGVARVSLGCEFAQAVLASVERATREVLERGTFEALADGVSYPEANGLFAHA